jgi:myxalamid-type polyketide synthase MxaE and MxaD
VWRDDASYLITGGLGGLGLKIARWMAACGARSIVLIGRRGLPPRDEWKALAEGSRERRQADAIGEIESLGAAVTIVAADVADDTAMEALFGRFGDGLPALAGIVHAAATLGDETIEAMNDETLAAMLRPKSAGTMVLDRLSRDLPLDFFVLFSSTTALWGSRGLAHYAAANHFLDAWAHHRRGEGRPALSINWGTWDEMRVASSADRELVAGAGLNAMPSDRALEALGDLLGSGELAQVTVASVDWTVLKAIYEARRERPLLSQVASRQTAASVRGPAAVPELAEQLAATEPARRRDVVVGFLREEVARALGVTSPLMIDVEQGLFEMGMDSLMSVELKGRIEVAVGLELPSTLTFNYPNITALTDFLIDDALATLDGDVTTDDATGPEASPTVPAPLDTPGQDDLDRDDLDEDDLEAMLAARLARLQAPEDGP